MSSSKKNKNQKNCKDGGMDDLMIPERPILPKLMIKNQRSKTRNRKLETQKEWKSN